jgi:hypothetical protein
MLNVFKIQTANFEHIHQYRYSFAQLNLKKIEYIYKLWARLKEQHINNKHKNNGIQKQDIHCI